ncbi:catechol o-methyltransferase domain-containing protein [Anaeramoeba flamelloides]|uniref:Catechol o-methyltransferase domain-containing protein n=1 Tax=Anaeramoeba flamelloides TaxID=1746091 RepID=A0AAV7YIX2_9EUKA|nr:catechol o-methyltransferase domain-containing protein [Anaeramoeba flamelloides]
MSFQGLKNDQGVRKELLQYINDNTVKESDILTKCRTETKQMKKFFYQIPQDEGQFLKLLMRMNNCKKGIEVGVFTGYSAICFLECLPEEGKLIALDISEEFTNKALNYIKEAGLSSKFDLRLGPACDSLEEMCKNEELLGTFDFMFIDADKINYESYYEYGLKLVRQNGLIIIDNTLWSGRVIMDEDQTKDTIAIRKLNTKIGNDERVYSSLLTVGDGVTVCFKK